MSVADDILLRRVLREEYEVDDPGPKRPSLEALLAAAEKAAEARRAASRERQRASRQRMAQRQLDAVRAYDRERKRARREALTPEQLMALRTREIQPQGLTDEEFEAMRAARRERERRRQEARMREMAKLQEARNESTGTNKRSSITSVSGEIGDDCEARRQITTNARGRPRGTEKRRPPRRAPTNDESDDEYSERRRIRRSVACVNDVAKKEVIGAARNTQPTCVNCMLRDGTLRRRPRRCYDKCMGKDDMLPEHANHSSQTEQHITLVWCPRQDTSTRNVEVQVDLL
ncbi:uncharacterized protein LOC119179990 isoform X1 [Rhipicephalus microplus]|uniref:uncharacterized protein LOC119179990 isoform X1 n=1 Tax=Rhipicephalus microplus TaxID=6941 RepID=UPI003F6B88EB